MHVRASPGRLGSSDGTNSRRPKDAARKAALTKTRSTAVRTSLSPSSRRSHPGVWWTKRRRRRSGRTRGRRAGLGVPGRSPRDAIGADGLREVLDDELHCGHASSLNPYRNEPLSRFRPFQRRPADLADRPQSRHGPRRRCRAVRFRFLVRGSGRTVRGLVRRSVRGCGYRGGQDPAAVSAGDLLRRTVHVDRPHRTHRPHADLRRAVLPPDAHGLRRALQHGGGPLRALQLRPPRPESPVPEPVYGRIRRRSVLSGLINQYEAAA